MDPFIGEIRLVPFNFAPRGWAICAGQLLPINQNQALFALLGTTYGGDGRTTFALPDLRGRIPVGAGQPPAGSSYPLGATGGQETVKLTTGQLPGHAHAVHASSAAGTTKNPTTAFPAGGGAYAAERNVTYESGDDRPDGRRRGAREPAALSEPELHHCAPGDLPGAELTGEPDSGLRAPNQLARASEGRPCRAAATASRREFTPRARSRWRTWFRTVSGLRWSSCAICFVESPCSRRRSTSA